MGRTSDDGSGRPNDGGSPDDLPDLPDEWGVIVIPDDLSELADEVAAVRAELHRTAAPRSRWERFTARPAVRGLRRLGAAGVRAPTLIVVLALLVTLASLFASTWSGPARSPATQRSANTTDVRGDTLPALELIGADGQTVALRGRLPAVILLTDGCDCARLVADSTTAVRPGVAVLTVTSTTPSTGTVPPTGATPQPQGKTVLALQDPTGELRSHLGLGEPDGTAAALLVDRGGLIRQTFRQMTSVEVVRADLARL